MRAYFPCDADAALFNSALLRAFVEIQKRTAAQYLPPENTGDSVTAAHGYIPETRKLLVGNCKLTLLPLRQDLMTSSITISP